MSTENDARIVSLHLCVGHREPMQDMKRVKVIKGFGIEGDRHATSTGIRQSRQILLMDEETLESFSLVHGQIRENITTSGINLHSMLEGQRMAIGDDVVVRITGFCAPCPRMDEIRSGLRKDLENQRGMLAFVEQGGAIKVGDTIRAMTSATAQ